MQMSRSAGTADAAARRGRAAYVVLTHRDWPQVRRLVAAILSSSPEAYVLVAHDARRERFPLDTADPRVEIFEHGLETDWGSWELVEATLRAFELARERADPDLVCLISGQDYPVRRLLDWEAEALAAESWIGEAEPLSYLPHWGRRRGEGDDRLTRYTYWWFRTPAARLGLHLPGHLGDVLRRVRDAVALRLEPVLGVRVVARGRGVHWGIRRPRTPFTASRPCAYGSQWLALRRPELDRLLDVDLAPRSPLRRLYRHSIIPDESGLVTPLLWRAAPSSLAPVTQVIWDEASDQPTTRTLADLPALVESRSPFCRKVDPAASGPLLEALDGLIAARPGS